MKKEKEFNIWMVRAGSGSYLIEEFLSKGIAAIGWNETEAIGEGLNYEELKEKVIIAYPDWSRGKINQTAGQVWRFYNDFQIGDKIITYDSDARIYYIGEIKSKYSFNNKLEYKHYRKVKWNDGAIDRDDLKIESRNTLGSILTVFEISKEVYNNILESHPGYLSEEDIEEHENLQKEYEQNELENLKRETVSRSFEFIKDMISQLSSDQLEELSAGIMRAMGYKTRMTPKSGDLGSDILASPDGLSMVEPIIKVEVKHKTKSNKVTAPEIRSFIGGLRAPTKGIYISSTGFTKEADYEAQRANFPLTLVNMDYLVELILEYYEELDAEVKTLVPLRKIYWPV